MTTTTSSKVNPPIRPICIFFGASERPLLLWDKQVKNGHIRRIVDEDVKSLVLELSGTNVATTYITCPIKPRATLGIKLPFLVLIVKNMKKYFTFEIQILDDKDMHRRFRVSNFQSTTKVRPFCTTMPIGLSSGWNQIQFNLADFTRRAYGSTYMETTRLQIHANVRVRRIYFCDRLYTEDEMPNDFKMFLPMGKKKDKGKDDKKKPVETKASGADIQKPPEGVEALELEEVIPSGAPPSPEGEAPPPEGAPPAESPPPAEGGEEGAPPAEGGGDEGEAPAEAPAEGEPAEGTEPPSETTEPTTEPGTPAGTDATDTAPTEDAPTTEPTETTDAPTE